MNLLEDVLNWWKKPFDNSGTAFNWVLFVGLLVAAAWFWNHVLLQLTDEI